MPPLRRSSLNTAFDPRGTTPNVEVTTTIATRAADTAPNDDQPQTPQSCRATQATSRNTMSSFTNLPATPDCPLTHASSSGSQTETPVKQGRKISTTITDADVKKWMEKGTYGNEVLRKSIFDTTQDVADAGQTQKTNMEGEGGAADVGVKTSVDTEQR